MFSLLRFAHETKLSYIGGEGVHGGQGMAYRSSTNVPQDIQQCSKL